ncbi:hypothetical protein CXF82_13670 [Shewanella sp. GutDb-MelDb]|nr:hypothetical protein CXF82_13670 [Shewanella sp. GutDb-MelDb]
MMLSWLSEKLVTHSSHKRLKALKQTLRAALLGYFYGVVGYLWRMTKRHSLCLVKIANKRRQKQP